MPASYIRLPYRCFSGLYARLHLSRALASNPALATLTYPSSRPKCAKNTASNTSRSRCHRHSFFQTASLPYELPILALSDSPLRPVDCQTFFLTIEEIFYSSAPRCSSSNRTCSHSYLPYLGKID